MDEKARNGQSEIWTAIPGYPKYEISSAGAVRNIKTGLILKPFSLRGYKRVTIYGDHRPRGLILSRLVLLSFRGPAPDGHVAAHLNGDRGDDRLLNLAWVTPEENEKHKLIHGTLAMGERHGKARFQDADIVWIREAARRGLSWGKIAKKYHADKRTISHIVHRRTWAHIPETA